MKIIISMPTPELQKAAEDKVEDWTKQWGVFEKQQEKLNDEQTSSYSITYHLSDLPKEEKLNDEENT